MNRKKMNDIKNKKSIFIIAGIIISISVFFLLSFLLFNFRDIGHASEGPYPREYSDLFIVKYAPNGTLIWDINVGYLRSDEGYDIAVDSENNIYVVGKTYNFGNTDVFILKFNANGTQLWNTTWGTSGNEYGMGIATDNKNNLYIVGTTNLYSIYEGTQNVFVIKFNSSGTQLWNTKWIGSNTDIGKGIAIDNDTNIYIVGYTDSYGAGKTDAFVVKYNSNGTQLWNLTWGGSDFDTGNGIAIDNSSNVYIVGGSRSFGDDAFIAKFDSNGTQLWNTTWGGSDLDTGYDVTIDGDNNICITGFTQSFSVTKQDVFILKFNSSGMQLWNTTWEGGTDYDEGYDIAVDNMNNIYITGHSGSYYFILKYKSNGAQSWSLNPGVSKYFRGNGIIVDNSNNIYITGLTCLIWCSTSSM